MIHGKQVYNTITFSGKDYRYLVMSLREVR